MRGPTVDDTTRLCPVCGAAFTPIKAKGSWTTRCPGCKGKFAPGYKVGRRPAYTPPALDSTRVCTDCGLTKLIKQFWSRADYYRSYCLACHRQRKWASAPEHECQGCGQAFRPKEANRSQFCSRECYFASIHREPEPKPSCSECGKPTSRQGKLACSRACALAKGRRLHKEKYYVPARTVNPFSTITCKYCGNTFECNFIVVRRLFCSKRCTERYTKDLRTARLRTNGQVEQFSRYEIYKRDGWHCQICGRKVERRLRSGDRMSATLDHVIPVSRGGQHMRANVRLAHMICNSLKRDGDGGQLLLFAN